MVNESSILRPCFDILYPFHFYVGVEKPNPSIRASQIIPHQHMRILFYISLIGYLHTSAQAPARVAVWIHQF
jgi:hypothetical protein